MFWDEMLPDATIPTTTIITVTPEYFTEYIEYLDYLATE